MQIEGITRAAAALQDFAAFLKAAGLPLEVDVAEARSAMLAAAGERPLPRPRAREVAEILVHRPIPDATVRQWCSRGRLAPVNVRGGVRLYRPRDIADLALVSAS